MHLKVFYPDQKTEAFASVFIHLDSVSDNHYLTV
ncbi:hypothetical protein BQ6471_01808 [Vibrio gazogenes]|nr:hypothetical protein BQ6471_01808 [Vibrio gazogenes]